MSIEWIEALLTPWRATRTVRVPRPFSAREAVALIVQGQVSTYNRAAERYHELPRLGDEALVATEPDVAILLALGLQVYANREAIDRFEDLALRPSATSTPGVTLAAAILGSIALAEVGEFERAIRLLQTRRNEEQEQQSMAAAYIDLHLGWRYAEQGDFTIASSLTQRSLDEVPPSRTYLRRTLRAYALSNLWAYGASQSTPLGPPPSSTVSNERSLLLSRIAVDQLRRDFEESFRASSTRILRFGGIDTTDEALFGALFMAETSADFAAARTARGALARHRLLSTREEPSLTTSEAFRLLCRSADHSAVRLAARSYYRFGPIEPLRDAAHELARQPWPTPYRRAILSLLQETADVMEAGIAREAFQRLLSLLEKTAPVSRADGDIADAAIGALSALGRSANGSQLNEQVERLLLRWAESYSDPAMDETIARALRQLDSTSSSPSRDNGWLRFLRSRIDDASRLGVAATAASVLIERGNGEARNLVLERLEPDRNLLWVAVLVDTETAIPDTSLPVVFELAEGSVRQRLSDAEQGRYSLSAVDAVGLLATLALRYPGQSGSAWSTIVSVLTNPRASSEDKASACEALWRSADRIPHDVRGRLRSSVGAISEGVSFFPSDEPLMGPALRLSIALDAIDASSALAQLLELVSAGDVVRRVDAARTLPLFARLAPPSSIAVTLGLALTGDESAEVRAAAGQALCEIDVVEDQAIREVIAGRLLSLLKASGVTEPLGVLRGLYSARTQWLGEWIGGEIRDLADKHSSLLVRDAAAGVLSLPTSPFVSGRQPDADVHRPSEGDRDLPGSELSVQQFLAERLGETDRFNITSNLRISGPHRMAELDYVIQPKDKSRPDTILEVKYFNAPSMRQAESGFRQLASNLELYTKGFNRPANGVLLCILSSSLSSDRQERAALEKRLASGLEGARSAFRGDLGLWVISQDEISNLRAEDLWRQIQEATT